MTEIQAGDMVKITVVMSEWTGRIGIVLSKNPIPDISVSYMMYKIFFPSPPWKAHTISSWSNHELDKLSE